MKDTIKIRNNDSERIHTLGLVRGSMLLYGISLELILKARGLFEEKDNILSKKIVSFSQFMNKWRPNKSDGHNYMEIVEYYQIELTEKEVELLENYQNYTKWAGRFPFPKNEDEITEMEKEGKYSGIAKSKHKIEIQNFIDKQIEIMKI